MWSYVSKWYKIKLMALLLLMVAVSISEMLSIGAIIPFLAVLTSPEKLFNYSLLKPFFLAMGFVDPVELVLPLTITFASAAAIAGLMRLILIAATTKISYGIGSELSIDIYKKTFTTNAKEYCGGATNINIIGELNDISK